mmetsp:Transcript_15081/g.34973  ORF Transcript_15081/g.34973 Transcript_15081/m.34973 type:complete len:314 (-) Transcript_15081:79-1020(-)
MGRRRRRQGIRHRADNPGTLQRGATGPHDGPGGDRQGLRENLGLRRGPQDPQGNHGRAGTRRVVDADAVRQPHQHPGPLRDHRAGDLGAVRRRHRRDRHRVRDGRDHLGDHPLPALQESRLQVHRRGGDGELAAERRQARSPRDPGHQPALRPGEHEGGGGRRGRSVPDHRGDKDRPGFGAVGGNRGRDLGGRQRLGGLQGSPPAGVPGQAHRDHPAQRGGAVHVHRSLQGRPRGGPEPSRDVLRPGHPRRPGHEVEHAHAGEPQGSRDRLPGGIPRGVSGAKTGLVSPSPDQSRRHRSGKTRSLERKRVQER